MCPFFEDPSKNKWRVSSWICHRRISVRFLRTPPKKNGGFPVGFCSIPTKRCPKERPHLRKVVFLLVFIRVRKMKNKCIRKTPKKGGIPHKDTPTQSCHRRISTGRTDWPILLANAHQFLVSRFGPWFETSPSRLESEPPLGGTRVYKGSQGIWN